MWPRTRIGYHLKKKYSEEMVWLKHFLRERKNEEKSEIFLNKYSIFQVKISTAPKDMTKMTFLELSEHINYNKVRNEPNGNRMNKNISQRIPLFVLIILVLYN